MVSPFVLKALNAHIENMDLGIRAKYRAHIIHEVLRNGRVSRAYLENTLKLRRGTISSVIRELVEIGVVHEEKPGIASGQGRPSIFLIPNPGRFVVLSFYIEGLRLRGGIVNLNEEILHEEELPIPKEADGQQFVKEFIKLWDRLSGMCPIGSEIVSGAFSPIGCVRSSDNLWISTNRWPSIREVDFNQVERQVGRRIILRRNLETMLAYEVSRNEEYARYRTVLVHWGYGIGSAYAYNGEVLRTERGTYTGIGHIQVNPYSGKQCQCGDYGCLEAESALWSMLPCIQELHVMNPEEAVDQPDILSGLSPETYPCFKSALHYFGIGMKTLCKIYAPDHILFLSPLSRNSHVNRLLHEAVSTAFPDSFAYLPTINNIGTSFHSCLYANAQPVIKDILDRLIRIE